MLDLTGLHSRRFWARLICRKQWCSYFECSSDAIISQMRNKIWSPQFLNFRKAGQSLYAKNNHMPTCCEPLICQFLKCAIFFVDESSIFVHNRIANTIIWLTFPLLRGNIFSYLRCHWSTQLSIFGQNCMPNLVIRPAPLLCSWKGFVFIV